MCEDLHPVRLRERRVRSRRAAALRLSPIAAEMIRPRRARFKVRMRRNGSQRSRHEKCRGARRGGLRPYRERDRMNLAATGGGAGSERRNHPAKVEGHGAYCSPRAPSAAETVDAFLAWRVPHSARRVYHSRGQDTHFAKATKPSMRLPPI